VNDLPEPGGAPIATTGEVPAMVPPVVVVMVTHDPGAWFDETLASLAAQTYPNLSVLVVDAASEVDPTPAVAARLPEAHVHRLEDDPGFGAAANVALELVEGAAFYLLCHDDIALEPGSVRALVEEAFRSNAGVIGPKLVDWHAPDRLLQVGMNVDKTGALAPIAERHELDQEQHDAVRDVFVVPGASTLVRADLFAALGGFDPAIVGLGDDVDLCWRAHVAGARVLIGPAARVRHLEAYGERGRDDQRRRELARHRLRTSLVAYGRWHRIRVLPQALLFALVEAAYAMLGGHPAHARDVLSAWPWNLRRLREVRARRRAVRATRSVSDKEVRALQVGGSARLSAFLRGQIGRREDRITVAARSSRDLAGAMREGGRQLTGTFAVILTLLLVVSTRKLVVDGLPVIGEFARFDASPRDLLATWWSGWRHAGLGSPGPQPTGLGILGLLGIATFGSAGLLRGLLLLGPIPLGALGAWRLAKPIGSARASVASFAVYLAIPVPYNALARGSWSGLAVYGLSPWLLLALGRASGIAPFGPAGAEPGDRAARLGRRPLPGLVLGLGLILAVVAALVPFVLVVAAVVAVALVVGSLLCFRVAGIARIAVAALGSIGVALVLHLPWALDVAGSRSPWGLIGGFDRTADVPLGLGEIVRFETGPWGAPPLGFAFLLAGALPVIIGRSWRLEWAVRAWMVVLAGWGALWAAQQGLLPGGLPAAEVILAPVASALGLAAALGLMAFETDLRAYRFGWRQLLSVAAALGVVLGAMPLASGLVDGRWRTPETDFQSGLARLLDDDATGAFRVVWLGDPEVLPAPGWRFTDQVAYAATDGGVPDVTERFVVPEEGATPRLPQALRAAAGKRTNRLGRLLAPMGVRYLVVQTRLAPSAGPSAAEDRSLAPVLAFLQQQLDLVEVPVTDGVVVYRNESWAPMRSVLPPREGERPDVASAAEDDLRRARPALRTERPPDGASGRVPAAGDLLVSATADDGWHLRVAGVPMARTVTYGWSNQFAATRPGPASLRYETPVGRRAAAAGQAALWALVFVAWVAVRRRRGPVPEEPAS
jgi:GT2 family glycosyltransferase